MTEAMQTPAELEKEFYSKPFQFSYSSLNKLMYAPSAFYDWYVLKQKEDRTDPWLINGKIIHCLILEPKNFEKQFLIQPGKVPTGNNKAIVDYMFNIQKTTKPEERRLKLAEYQPEIIHWLETNNLHQKLTDDAKRMNKILDPNNVTYFEFLQQAQEKTIIDQESLDFCEDAVKVVKKNAKISDLMKIGQEGFELLSIDNEILIDYQLKSRPFGLKGILDNLVVDYDKKVVYINDLKTTSKSLVKFEESVEFWNYWMQAAIYQRLALAHLLKNNVDVDTTWKVVFTFIVVDKYLQVYPFEVSNFTMSEWQKQLDGKLNEAKYHYENRDYSLPFKFVADQVLL